MSGTDKNLTALCSEIQQLKVAIDKLSGDVNALKSELGTEHHNANSKVISAAILQSAVDRIVEYFKDNNVPNKRSSDAADTKATPNSKTTAASKATASNTKKAANGKLSHPNLPKLTVMSFKSASRFVTDMHQHYLEDLQKIIPVEAMKLALENAEYKKVSSDSNITNKEKAAAFKKALFSIKPKSDPLYKEMENAVLSAMHKEDEVRKTSSFNHINKEEISNEEKTAIAEGPYADGNNAEK